MHANPRTRSAADKLRFLPVILIIGLLMLACSQTYYNAIDLTATAQGPATATATLTPITATSTIPKRTATPTRTRTTAPTRTPTTTRTMEVSPSITANTSATQKPPIIYYTQSGDTLPVICIRFDVQSDRIAGASALPPAGLLEPGTLVVIPDVLESMGPKEITFPDSEVVYSPSALDFNTVSFVSDASGYLNDYREYLPGGWYTGAQLVERVAIENSVNPRLLLALLEYQSGWVYGQPASLSATDYPMGYVNTSYKGLYNQLSWAISQLSVGFYNWREGLLTELDFPAKTIRIAPMLNAGTVAVQYLFSQLVDDPVRWMGVLNGSDSLTDLYQRMFGNPWLRAETVEPLYPTTLTQPRLELPFGPGETWAFTGGPHSAWGPDGALAALDFAPQSEMPGCYQSEEWITASAPGLVVRVDRGLVIVDLDGDGSEQTGWVLEYMHVATRDRVTVGTWLDTNDRIGHPSCEGGLATGNHVHIARKYNGEWILANGPVPFVLSGYTAHAGDKPYAGTLVKDGTVVTADPNGSYISLITRPAE
jgi:LasA protease